VGADLLSQADPQPAAGQKPNPPPKSPIQSVWMASFSTVAKGSFSSVYKEMSDHRVILRESL
jgi:hypothetical protein